MFEPECPYCGAGQEINHDDGYGYAEDEIYQQVCGDCEKTYAFTTSILFSYDLTEAPCLNGGQHKFEATFTIPAEYTKMVCNTCGERRAPTDEEMVTVLAYHEQVRERAARLSICDQCGETDPAKQAWCGAKGCGIAEGGE
jgi:hypothetical protein